MPVEDADGVKEGEEHREEVEDSDSTSPALLFISRPKGSPEY